MWIFGILAVLNRFSEDPDFVNLCDENYTEYLKPRRNVILFFKSENCQFCQFITPAVRITARNLRRRGTFCLVDVDKCPKTRAYFRAAQTPTFTSVKYFRHIFNINSSDINSIARRTFSYPSKNVRDFGEVLEFADKNNSFFLIDHYLSDAENDILESFTPEHEFYSLPSFNNAPVQLTSKIMYYRSTDRQFVDVGNVISKAAISSFLATKTTPMFVEFKPEIVDSVIVDGEYVIMVLFDIPKDDFGNEQYELMTQLMETGKKIIYFSQEQNKLYKELLHPQDDQETVVAVLKWEQGKEDKWVCTDEDGDPVLWVRQVISGVVPTYVKSEAIPKDNSGSVKKIVAKTWSAIVGESKLPVVLLAYQSENYAFDFQLEKLNEASVILGDIAVYGFCNIDKNDVPVEVKEAPGIVIINDGKTVEYTKDIKMPLTDWIRSQIGSNEL